MVASNTSPIFGLGFLDIEPGYDVYYPWFVSQPTWTTPASAENQFNNLTNIVDSSTNQTQVQQAVQAIDLLNSQTLPNLIICYPYTIWVYRAGAFTGMPATNATNGFDMGAISLNPYTFSQIQLIGATQSSSTSSTQSSSTSQSSNTSSSTQTLSASTSQSSNTTLIVAGIIVVIIVIAAVVMMTRRRGSGASAEPSPA